MAAREQKKHRTTESNQEGGAPQVAGDPVVPTPRRGRRAASSQAAPAEQKERVPARRRRAPKRDASTQLDYNRPAVVPCLVLDDLQSLSPNQARHRVNDYLHAVMSTEDADAFEALAYRWELHLVEVEQLQLVRGVDLDTKKVRRYTTVLRQGGGFPPLIGLGSEGSRVTENVLLCDGYHRADAIRRAGIHFVWAWLAVDLWREVPAVAASHPAAARV